MLVPVGWHVFAGWRSVCLPWGGATAQAPGAARLVCADTFTQRRWGLVAVPLPESEGTYLLSCPTHCLELRLSLGGEIWAPPLRFMEAWDT